MDADHTEEDVNPWEEFSEDISSEIELTQRELQEIYIPMWLLSTNPSLYRI